MKRGKRGKRGTLAREVIEYVVGGAQAIYFISLYSLIIPHTPLTQRVFGGM